MQIGVLVALFFLIALGATPILIDEWLKSRKAKKDGKKDGKV